MNSTVSSTDSWKTTPASWSSSSCCPHPTQTGTSRCTAALLLTPLTPPRLDRGGACQNTMKDMGNWGKHVSILYSSVYLRKEKLLVGCDADSPPLYHKPLPISPLKCSTCAQSMPLIYCLSWSGGLYEGRVEKRYLVTGSESQGPEKFVFKVSLICAGHIRVFQVTPIYCKPINATNRTCSEIVLIGCLTDRSFCTSLFILCWFMLVN